MTLPFWAKLLLPVLGIAALGAGVAYLLDREFDKGYDAANAEWEAAQMKANAATVTRILDMERELARASKTLVLQLDRIEVAMPIRLTRLDEVLHENPDFATAQRPADLQRLRDERREQVRRVAAAAYLR